MIRSLQEEIRRLREVNESELQINIKVLQDEVIRLTDLLSKNEEYTKMLTGHVCQETDLQKRVQ